MQTDSLTYRQTDRHSDRLTDSETHRETYTFIQVESGHGQTDKMSG